LWDLVKRQKIRTFSGHTDEIWGVTFNPSGTLVATSSEDKSVRLWDVTTGETVRVLRGHQNSVFRSQFTQDGRYLISASQDRTLRIWDTDSGMSLRVLQGHTAGVTTLATHHQSLFSASYDGKIMRWQVELPYLKMVDLPSEPASVAIAPDGQHVAVGFADGTLSWYSLPEVQLKWKKAVHTADIQRLRFDSQGNWLASASFDKTAKLWQVSGNKLTKQRTFSGHTDAIYALAFSSNSQILATASYDGQFGLFNIDHEQKRFHQAHDGFIYSVNFDSTGTRLLTAGADGYTKLWDIIPNPPVLLQTFPQAQDEVMWASFSSDDQRIAVVGRDWLVHIYSINDVQNYHFVGHESTIFRVAFTPNGHQVVTASGDATVRFWDLFNENELFALHLPTSLENIPLWDFDFRCVGQDCWIAVPLTSGKLVLYQLENIYN
jgi:WD40 repeat protein